MDTIEWIISLIFAVIVMYAFTTGSSNKSKVYEGVDAGSGGYSGSNDGDCGSGDGGCDGGGGD